MREVVSKTLGAELYIHHFIVVLTTFILFSVNALANATSAFSLANFNIYNGDNDGDGSSD